MRIVHTQFSKVGEVMLGLHAVGSPCALYSFTMSCRVLVRVVYLAGYWFARDISGTAVLLAI